MPETRSEKSIVITFETLFELLTKEKSSTELQAAEPTLYRDMSQYLDERSRHAEQIENDNSVSFEEKMKAKRQLENLRKIIRDLYGRRERKILLLALDKSRTKSNIINTSVLLEEEKQLFDALTNTLDSFRRDILESVLGRKEPLLRSIESISKKTDKINESNNTDNVDNGIDTEEDFKSASELASSTKLVRFIHAVPKFVGRELEEYGPFQEEDVANLPKDIAELLVSKGRVEEIRES